MRRDKSKNKREKKKYGFDKDSAKQVCKDGYRVGCRRIIGLNRCFMKGYFGGYQLAVTGIDANNGIYLIAYAAIESENQASWLWFLELLALDLEIISPYHLSFMYDK
ncbi:hypothetical protein J1N35_037815 [Gossypium stocksii]|uniref:MULE transposase domain-containing protein n=1 Tax=Gossypium stocksii TaxID=47602 RepID=A0A9D3UKH3_9ROSI|nr:hypothetical protein J1N35_037815 [Gossypium stocksii]